MNQATEIIHWPGKDVPACDKHAKQLRGVGEAMGFPVSSTPCYLPIACTNCANESKKEKS